MRSKKGFAVLCIALFGFVLSLAGDAFAGFKFAFREIDIANAKVRGEALPHHL